MQIPKFIVMTARAAMPASCNYGPYGKVAVVETDGENMPKQIHPRHRKVKNIHYLADRLWIGKMKTSAYAHALTEARKLADSLNAFVNPT